MFFVAGRKFASRNLHGQIRRNYSGIANNVLVLNCGSSSLKFQVIDPAKETTHVSGIADRINSGDGPTLKFNIKNRKEKQTLHANLGIRGVVEKIAGEGRSTRMLHGISSTP